MEVQSNLLSLPHVLQDEEIVDSHIELGEHIALSVQESLELQVLIVERVVVFQWNYVEVSLSIEELVLQIDEVFILI